ncbi:MAG TPA: hypothetical protein VFM13_14910 [Gaiellaceae bacterium]|nr:hypothetical protein [Gaiellaceae bacterium]
MRQQAADRQIVLGRGNVRVEAIVQGESPFVPEAHDAHGRDGLRDRGDAVLVIRRRLLPALGVGEPTASLQTISPSRTAAALTLGSRLSACASRMIPESSAARPSGPGKNP